MFAVGVSEKQTGDGISTALQNWARHESEKDSHSAVTRRGCRVAA